MFAFRIACICLLFGTALSAFAQNKYEKQRIDKVDISFGKSGADEPMANQYRLIAREALGPTYSTLRVRDAINALYSRKTVDTVTVSASSNASGGVDLLFDIKRKVQADKVTVVVGQTTGDPVLEQDILFKLNLLTPGTPITEQILRNNADEILDYLRERGFYQSTVTYERKPIQNENEVGVTFKVTPNTQAKVEEFRINIEGLQKPILPSNLKLHAGESFSRDRLTADLVRIRDVLRKDNFLAPELDDPRITYDSDKNTVSIDLKGKVGPSVTVKIESEKVKVSESTQMKLLPIKRDGTLDYAAIVEGQRRLENYYQEQGYFFAHVTPACSVTPILNDSENNPVANNTEFLCSILSGEDLTGRKVEVDYRAALDRRLKLTTIRIRGTDKLTVEDVSSVLGSQVATILGVVPFLGYGRGYTSETILEDDRTTIKSLMSELGYRDAQVRVNQGVSATGDELIITFVVEEGAPTVVSDVSITGNNAIPTSDLMAQLPVLTSRNYSRARVRNAVQKLSEYYSKLGYYDARVVSSVIETPTAADASVRNVKLEFKVQNEGKKVRIDRILVNGNNNTRTDAIVKALTLQPGDLLRATDIYTSEQNLYATDAFSRVDVKVQPKGDSSTSGERLTDVLVSVEEQPPRLISYGGGYSTDVGANGFFDIRHSDLFGKLWQGGARVKMSQQQQLVQFDLVNPRFIHDGPKRFAPLTFSVLYQRDATITRFFRSAFDKGTFGIVQRVDDKGNPIDTFGMAAGNPTLNRFAVSAETSRTVSQKSRSFLFIRYRYEDVRLFNIESLLIKELLRPDQKTVISGFGSTFVRDTRQNCAVKYSLLELIAKGDQVNPCRYNVSDPTRGDYLTADFNVSVPALGANVGFVKFQASYNFYRTFAALKNTTFAARGLLGVGQVFSGGDRFTNAAFPSLNGLLPISERFFAGGSNSLRGFNFEEAGPRVVIVPAGIFRNSKGEQVRLDPFTVPFGGNALAGVNLEARVPISKSLRAVPFYDGGNVFRRVGDIFKAPPSTPNNPELQNQRALWTNTVGLGLRIKTPVGGEFGFDYGRLLNPSQFLIPQTVGPNAVYTLPKDHLHFRFSQAF